MLIKLTPSKLASLFPSFLFPLTWHFGPNQQVITRAFFVQSQNVTRKKAFVRKICAFNVDVIDHSYRNPYKCVLLSTPKLEPGSHSY